MLDIYFLQISIQVLLLASMYSLHLVVNDLSGFDVEVIAITAFQFVYLSFIVIIVLGCTVILVEVFSNCVICFIDYFAIWFLKFELFTVLSLQYVNVTHLMVCVSCFCALFCCCVLLRINISYMYTLTIVFHIFTTSWL